jgi:beta-xylosidase
MKFQNPIISVDYSDPDVIRVGKDFYMVSSSFNFCPGIPLLHSLDLVHWEIINYISSDLIPGFDKVRPGEGAWAPSIRFHHGLFYVMVPFPDEGLFVSTASDPYKEWSPLRCLLKGKGYEDPCPVWLKNGETYVVFAFVKSRIGFNSKLAVIKTDENLTKAKGEYKVIFEGNEVCQGIEGPKFYLLNNWIYIFAPAGGVSHGFQLALRSKEIYGPYEWKIILKENGNGINGPHQGALVSLDEKNDYAFIHFSDQGNIGRIVYLEPVFFTSGGWPSCGKEEGPVLEGQLNIQEKHLRLDFNDDFINHLSLHWQTPCSVERKDWISSSCEGLKMNAKPLKETSLRLFPYVLTEKIPSFSFEASVEVVLNLEEGEEIGFGLLGSQYGFINIFKKEGKYYSGLTFGTEEEEEHLEGKELDGEKFILSFSFASPESMKISCLGLEKEIKVEKEHWNGLRIALYARGSKGFGVFSNLKIEK